MATAWRIICAVLELFKAHQAAKMFRNHCAGLDPSNNTASIRHGGSDESLLR